VLTPASAPTHTVLSVEQQNANTLLIKRATEKGEQASQTFLASKKGPSLVEAQKAAEKQYEQSKQKNAEYKKKMTLTASRSTLEEEVKRPVVTAKERIFQAASEKKKEIQASTANKKRLAVESAAKTMQLEHQRTKVVKKQVVDHERAFQDKIDASRAATRKLENDAQAAEKQQAELFAQAEQQAEREERIRSEKESVEKATEEKLKVLQILVAADEAYIREEAELDSEKKHSQISIDLQAQIDKARDYAIQHEILLTNLLELMATTARLEAQNASMTITAKQAAAPTTKQAAAPTTNVPWTKSYIGTLLATCTKLATGHAASLGDVLPTIRDLNDEFEEIKKRMETPVATAATSTRDPELLYTAKQHLVQNETVGERAGISFMCTLRNKGMWLRVLKKQVWPAVSVSNKLHNKTRTNPEDPRAPTNFCAWVQEYMGVKDSKRKHGWTSRYIFALETLADVCITFPAFIYAQSADPDLTLKSLYDNVSHIKIAITKSQGDNV
jgi:hypothetical protein